MKKISHEPGLPTGSRLSKLEQAVYHLQKRVDVLEGVKPSYECEVCGFTLIESPLSKGAWYCPNSPHKEK